jgi:glucose-6-phosphate dehydrogenase assembly protein OpcA
VIGGETFWGERETSPAAIADALGRLLRGTHEDGSAHSPARALNLVVTFDGEWRGEVINRLDRVGRSHPSRTIAFAVEPGRQTLDARVSINCAPRAEHGTLDPCREWVEIAVGPDHLAHLDSIAAPIVLADLPTVVWSPHRHGEAVSSLISVADAILIDTLEEPSTERAIRGARALAERTHLVDLTWIRNAPWRERLAALFEPADWRRAPLEISGATLVHASGSGMASLLLVGWLGSQLSWKPRPLLSHDGALYAKLRGRRQHVELRLGVAGGQVPPGLDGITVETASAAMLSLQRHEGGFAATRRAPRGDEREWAMLGAFPGEDRVLGDGIRQALLRDPAYEDALEIAEGLLPEETLL